MWAAAAGGVGYAVYTYKNLQTALQERPVDGVSPYPLALFRTLPLNSLTAMAGRVASLNVPECLRRPFYGAFAWLYSCNLDESALLSTYPTFNHFFTRELKDGLRPVSSASLVSPADGKLLACGRLDGTTELFPEQVKGVKYSLRRLLGEQFEELGLHAQPSKTLHYCSVYLAPGSYHRFHSPADRWNVGSVRRVRGEVLPVAEWAMKLFPGLVSLNERAVISGSWRYGKMVMIPVGATNVSTISLKWGDGVLSRPERLAKGEQVGQFELGSLVILIFEAPKNFSWAVSPGSWLKYGQALGESRTQFSWWPF